MKVIDSDDELLSEMLTIIIDKKRHKFSTRNETELALVVDIIPLDLPPEKETGTTVNKN